MVKSTTNIIINLCRSKKYCKTYYNQHHIGLSQDDWQNWSKNAILSDCLDTFCHSYPLESFIEQVDILFFLKITLVDFIFQNPSEM